MATSAPEISADKVAAKKLEEERIAFLRACCIQLMGDGQPYEGEWWNHVVDQAGKLWDAIEATRSK
jgi:hypothetical protein